MKNKKVVIFDIDGVLADFEGKFCEDFGNENRHLYNLGDRYPEVDPELIKEWVLNPENYKDLEPIFGGITLLNEFKSRGFHILLLTARSKSLLKVTTGWLEKYHINYDEIYFGKNKVEIIKDYQHMNANKKIMALIDDSNEILEELKKHFTFPCIRWLQPWNVYNGTYPVALYSPDVLKILINHGDNIKNPWKPFWSNK